MFQSIKKKQENLFSTGIPVSIKKKYFSWLWKIILEKFIIKSFKDILSDKRLVFLGWSHTVFEPHSVN